MRHYARHIGDWIAATAHLSEIEEAIYSRLLDQYYMREGPLPLNLDQCRRLARAQSKEARAAVEVVLKEFFSPLADGWHQKRADAEVAAYKEKSAKASEAASVRWSERDASAMRTHMPPQCERNANHEPVTKNQQSKALVRVPLTEPTEEHRRIANERGISCEAEFAKYRDWMAATGKRHKDEVAGFRNWLRNAKGATPGRPPTLAEKRAANIAALTGQVKRERIVEGTAERVGGAVISALPSLVRESDDDDVGRCSDGRGSERLG